MCFAGFCSLLARRVRFVLACLSLCRRARRRWRRLLRRRGRRHCCRRPLEKMMTWPGRDFPNFGTTLESRSLKFRRAPRQAPRLSTPFYGGSSHPIHPSLLGHLGATCRFRHDDLVHAQHCNSRFRREADGLLLGEQQIHDA